MTLTLTIPAPCKPINSNDSINRHVRAKYVKLWRTRAHVAAIQAGRPKMTRAHITYTVHATTNRKRDVGNFYPTVKACIDGIVSDTGVLPGDDDRFVVGPDPRPGVKAEVFTLVITFNDTCGCGDCLTRFGEVA